MFDTNCLLISLIFSSIGLGYFIYGKKQKHTVAYYTGLCLMVCPYIITDPMLMAGIGVGLMFVPKFVRI
jgi:C4-dicarboxylate transporter